MWSLQVKVSENFRFHCGIRNCPIVMAQYVDVHRLRYDGTSVGNGTRPAFTHDAVGKHTEAVFGRMGEDVVQHLSLFIGDTFRVFFVGHVIEPETVFRGIRERVAGKFQIGEIRVWGFLDGVQNSDSDVGAEKVKGGKPRH